eukprot:Amastigsp_a509619_13.p6 type:complete len:160 gc:universal Amastigsp_a509619_13:446-925(+)
MTRLAWSCSKKSCSEGPRPRRHSVPKRVKAAARMAGDSERNAGLMRSTRVMSTGATVSSSTSSRTLESPFIASSWTRSTGSASPPMSDESTVVEYWLTSSAPAAATFPSPRMERSLTVRSSSLMRTRSELRSLRRSSLSSSQLLINSAKTAATTMRCSG